MRSAPSVSYPVGRSLWSGALALALWTAGAAGLVAWAASGAGAWRLSLAGVASVAAGAWALAAWWRQPAGLLGWDGARWSWSTGDGPVVDGCGVRAVLDLQSGLLLRLSAPEGARWLWLERSRLPARWDALRRAVYSPAADQAPSPATPPPARP